MCFQKRKNYGNSICGNTFSKYIPRKWRINMPFIKKIPNDFYHSSLCNQVSYFIEKRDGYPKGFPSISFLYRDKEKLFANLFFALFKFLQVLLKQSIISSFFFTAVFILSVGIGYGHWTWTYSSGNFVGSYQATSRVNGD